MPFRNKIAILIVCFLFCSQSSFSQQLPIEFSNSLHSFTGFAGSGFSFNQDPTDASNDVGQFYNDGSEAWQGFTIDLKRSIDLDFQQTIYLSFYGFDPNKHNIILKLEKGPNSDVQVTIDVPSGGGWTDSIPFDFSKAVLSSDGSTSVNAKGKYDKLTILIDGGTPTPGTYLLDNINDGSVAKDPNEIDVEYKKLVWADNFDVRGAVNSTNWHHQTKVIVPNVGWANGEVQHYTNRTDNSFVDDSGFLHIVAKKEKFTDQGLTKNYTSARLNSKFAFTYGRIDVRAKLPIEQGTWPAIWTLGKNINETGGYWQPTHGSTSWPECGEIDIMEHGIFPSEDINFISSALHTPCCHAGSPNKGGTIANNLGTDFHVYSVNWSPNQITFLLDGVGYYTYNPTIKDARTWPFVEDQYILLNVALGGYAGTVSSSFTEDAMIIDYVKVYQEGEASVGHNFNLNEAIQLFPNPSNDKITITSDVALSSLSLYDVYGKMVLTKDTDLHSIDVSNLSAGVYLMEIYSNKNKAVKHIVVR